MKLLPQLLRTVGRCLARHEAQASRGPLLAAVSGGLDSTAMAWVLAGLREAGGLGAERGPLKVVLAHVDHGVFPGSEAGLRTVEQQARLLGHGFLGLRLQPTHTSEEALREARYKALAAMARQCGARMILTAHHADDNLETILFRMLRGTGPRGLCGIPEGRRLDTDLWVVRPFLNTRRQTLHRALHHGNSHRLRLELPPLPTVTDPTNEDLAYARNHLRHEVIPQLRAAMGFRLDSSLFALARSARAAAEVLTAQGSRLVREQARFPTPWRCELQVAAPIRADRPFLEEALVQAHQRVHPRGSAPPWSWVQRAVHLLHQPDGRRVCGPRTVTAERVRSGLLLVDETRAGAPPTEEQLLLPAAGETDVRFGETEWRILAARHQDPPLEPAPACAGPTRALLDPRHTRWPWRLRRRQARDRFRPLGQVREVGLRRFLMGRHVPRFDRDRLPLLVDADDQILWVPGVEIASAARVRLDTGECVEVRLRSA